ncbi:MAG TPA: hypothetical protein VJ952_06805 [Opitutales bacterium]|nr:hypothetical protein [Opitutales bacterium]
MKRIRLYIILTLTGSTLLLTVPGCDNDGHPEHMQDEEHHEAMMDEPHNSHHDMESPQHLADER